MKIVRDSVFETNSSSTHAVSVSFFNKNYNEWQDYGDDDGEESFFDEENDCSMYEPYPIDTSGVITIKGNDFSDPELYVRSIDLKLSLIAAYFILFANSEVKNMFEKVVKDFTGAKTIEYNVIVFGPDINSFISSCVADEVINSICTNEIRLKNFLFGKKSFLEAGTDNNY